MNILVIQPHRDDAVFSICEHLLGWLEDGHQVTLLTVFGAIPDWQPDETKHAVFDDEHQRVVKELGGVRDVQFNFHDDAAIERSPMPLYQTQGQIHKALRDFAQEGFYDATVWPMGIHHPDHLVVAGCRPRGRARVYEELPYRVMYPDLIDEEYRWGWVRVGSRDFLDRKKVLCRMYASQMGETEERCLWAPERVWEVT
jgi:LmbE family N-acetylglucosaminyl deacetylase